MKNKKGFTLVELLAVIVILATILLIAGTTVGPLMEKSKKNALSTEGKQLAQAGLAAYKVELGEGAFKSNGNVCFSMKYLCENGYYTKGCPSSGDNYSGSVLVVYSAVDEDYSTVYWIGNGTYAFEGVNTKYDGEIDAISIDETSSECRTADEDTIAIINQVLGLTDAPPKRAPKRRPTPDPVPEDPEEPIYR